VRKQPKRQRPRRNKKDKNPDRPMRQAVEARIPRPQFPLLRILNLPFVSHAGKSLKAAAKASIYSKVPG